MGECRKRKNKMTEKADEQRQKSTGKRTEMEIAKKDWRQNKEKE